MSEELSCRELCGKAAACCRMFTLIHLTDAEAAFMEQAGAFLEECAPTDEDPDMVGLRLAGGSAALGFVDRAPAGTRAYGFRRDCPHLVEEDGWTQCSIFDAPERPAACDSFRIGSLACGKARAQWNMFDTLREIHDTPVNELPDE